MFKIYGFVLLCFLVFGNLPAHSQALSPVNGIRDAENNCYVFTNATLHITGSNVIKNASLLIRHGKVEAVGAAISVPKDAIEIALNGKHIYPAFIDLWSGYGIQSPEKLAPKTNQFERPVPAAMAWNMAIHPETQVISHYKIKDAEAGVLRKAGFAAVVSHQQDGIARGSGALVGLLKNDESKSVIKPGVGMFYSFERGVSNQAYPSSQMGSIALLRQAFYDADWYKANPNKRTYNLSFEALNAQNKLPMFFEAQNWLEVLRADCIADEFKYNLIVKSGGDDYQRLDALKAAGIKLILPMNYPAAWDLSDAYSEAAIPLSAMLHWEAAPSNAELVRRAGIPFALTSDGVKEPGKFWEAIRKTIKAGLPESELIKAFTETPAEWIGASDIIGGLQPGKIANFFISTDSISVEQMGILETWVQGQRYIHDAGIQQDIRGTYTLQMTGFQAVSLIISGDEYKPEVRLEYAGGSAKLNIHRQFERIDLSWKTDSLFKQGHWSLNGIIEGDTLQGGGLAPDGSAFSWIAVKKGQVSPTLDKQSVPHETFTADSVKLYYPNAAFGFSSLPETEHLLISNATIWTCEQEGKLERASILISNGKIEAIGSLNKEKLLAGDAAIKHIDGKGLHITPGIIDEHSHIAISKGVNEAGQSVTAEVRIGDVIDPRDRSIYYALAGGVTTVQQLHGSANAIGGQSSLIKLKWGSTPGQMKIKYAPGHIKFALGENVKQSNWGHEYTVRYPQTRMGVEQVFYDAFSRAKEYQQTWNNWDELNASKKKNTAPPARDLELDALVEILEAKRFITCHSYVQSEINMLMHVADSMGFKVNTFTHILEGYKVADKMKKHGAAGSTFSDWWAYKMEVAEAIPYNGALMHEVGVLTGFNSDDAEMGRRLNQEAAKAVLYGGLSEEEALKFVTINPAKMLHIDKFTGSLKVGKDADFVIWDSNPLSIYAKAKATFVEGVRYYDQERDKELQIQANQERTRLRMKMIQEKSEGKKLRKTGGVKQQHSYECEDLIHLEENFLLLEHNR